MQCCVLQCLHLLRQSKECSGYKRSAEDNDRLMILAMRGSCGLFLSWYPKKFNGVGLCCHGHKPRKRIVAYMCVCVFRAPKRCDFTRCCGLFVMHSVLRTHHFASHLVEVCSTARHWFCVTRSVCKESAELFSVDTELSVRDQAHRLYITTFLRKASRTSYASTHAKRVKLMSRERWLFIS